MPNKPIFVATHPRACSTAFERVFMTRRDILQCAHEPFGDAFYFGPERLAGRYGDDEVARQQSGFSESTYKTIMDRINKENTEDKRLFIKDMAQYLMAPDDKPVSIAPSLLEPRRGVGTVVNGKISPGKAELTNEHAGSHFATQAGLADEQVVNVKYAPYSTPTERDNPTVVPLALLKQFQFAFLIRHPKNSIASFYRCCEPPLDEMTGWYDFRPEEAGYAELRRLFDYVRSFDADDADVNANGTITNGDTSHQAKHWQAPQPCIIDADDLLDKPAEVVEAFCEAVNIPFNPVMLNWDTEEEQKCAEDAFEKWKGWHEDAIDSKDLKPRKHKHTKSKADYEDDWVEKYGERGAAVIRKTVEENVEHYEYLKQFCVKV